jgi:hypothetical protein
MKNETNVLSLSLSFSLFLLFFNPTPEHTLDFSSFPSLLFETIFVRLRSRFNINEKADGKPKRKEIEGRKIKRRSFLPISI